MTTRQEAHREKMARKAEQRAEWYRTNGRREFPESIIRNGYHVPIFPASINRHTGRPHEHRREIERNLRRSKQP